MSFIAPLWLAAAAVVAAGVVVAHLFSTTIPPRDVLPTVRFVPEGAPLVVLRTRRVSDAWLLAMRLLAVALLGLALSGVHARRNAPARVVLLDGSRAVRSFAEVMDSARSIAGGGVVIAFDSAAERIRNERPMPVTAHAVRGSLSAGLVAAHRVLSETPDERARTELVIVSPLVREEMDSATARLLALWEGPVRVVRVAAAPQPATPSWETRAEGDDPVAAVIPSRARDLQVPSVRVVRTLPTRADSQWAEGGGALVVWPARNETAVLARRSTPDSQSGIAAAQHVTIAQFRRELQVQPGRALIRWTGGEPAATERFLGRGCVREVAIPVDAVGDLALRESFRGIARALLEPCGGTADFRPAVLPSSAATRGARFAPPVPSSARSLHLALALIAAALLLAEQALRTGRRTA